MAVAQLVRDAETVVAYAIAHSLVDPRDARWAYNAVLDAVGAAGPGPDALASGRDREPRCAEDALAMLGGDARAEVLEAPLERLAQVAVDNGREEDTPSGRDRVQTEVMGRLTPRPSEVARRFAEDYRRGPAEATDGFYRMSCDVRYVRKVAIARNVAWTSPTDWGDLEITINLSKPEKDPKAIAAAGSAPAGEAYPACQLCLENEGYYGRGAGDANGAHPARQNLRIVPIELGGEPWGLQYSPYAYFEEHCIAMSASHRPMHVDRQNMGRLLDFVDLLPHYFVGSNADLPIVGGSILSHDHFQGGRHVFPMMRAEVLDERPLAAWPEVSLGVVRWPLSTLRLRSADRGALLDAADHVLAAWRDWTDESVGVVAHDGDVAHNTVTPVARREEDGSYVLYLALRCNVTSEQNPLGDFHPHAQWHHIKKENIGLIEVMGLAILPPRLVDELGRVEELLVEGGDDLAQRLADDPLTSSHEQWALELSERGPIDAEGAHRLVRDGVGEVFQHVLEDAGVFKWDEAGRAAQQRFVDSL